MGERTLVDRLDLIWVRFTQRASLKLRFSRQVRWKCGSNVWGGYGKAKTDVTYFYRHAWQGKFWFDGAQASAWVEFGPSRACMKIVKVWSINSTSAYDSSRPTLIFIQAPSQFGLPASHSLDTIFVCTSSAPSWFDDIIPSPTTHPFNSTHTSIRLDQTLFSGKNTKNCNYQEKRLMPESQLDEKRKGERKVRMSLSLKKTPGLPPRLHQATLLPCCQSLPLLEGGRHRQPPEAPVKLERFELSPDSQRLQGPDVCTKYRSLQATV